MKKTAALFALALILPVSSFSIEVERYDPSRHAPNPHAVPGQSAPKVNQRYKPPVKVQQVRPFDLQSPILENYINWGYTKVNAKAAHDKGLDGRGVNIMVVDSGIVSHPEFNGQKIERIDMGFGAVDTYRHGTGLAGIIIAKGENMTGIAPGATLYSAKVDQGSGIISPLHAARAVNWAVEKRKTGEHRIDVINLSYGATGYDDDLAKAIKAAYAAGIVVVAPSGNDGMHAVKFPANMPEVFGVYATTPLDGPYTQASYGAQVDFAAPGASVFTTGLENNYMYSNGTSVAAPYISALAALAIQGYYHRNGVRPTPEQTKQILAASASLVSGVNKGKQGAGMVNAGTLASYFVADGDRI
ncbi:subtilisin family serine protease [Elusimicrobium posterum]|uniref:S8 family peptidase n=1 Tax=Elusimicrobium posterum TaxID=3116653 RepID=UPI003C72EC11